MRRFFSQRIVSSALFVVLIGLLLFITRGPSIERSLAEAPPRSGSDPFKLLGDQYNTYRAQYQDLTYAEMRNRLGPQPTYRETCPFDPTQARYFDLVESRLEMTEQERELISRNGFVSIDQGRSLSFPAAYQQVYTSDLPVFVTTDSILHALHRSYDEILKELEVASFCWTIDEVLANCQSALATQTTVAPQELNDTLKDVDLYLGVARKLLHTPPPASVMPQSGQGIRPEQHPTQATDVFSYSVLGQKAAVDAVIADIDSLRMQTPDSGDSTAIYGSQRWIDYSQFKPRGHYTESERLAAYFRCLMWLGRADCGWNVLPAEGGSAKAFDSRRELRNAVVLAELLRESGGTAQLRKLDEVLTVLVGRTDNFDVFQLSDLLQSLKITSVRELLHDDAVLRLQQAIAQRRLGEQLIRSQTLAQGAGSEATQPPAMFQLFGQRFTIGSFVLSRVVHDEIVYQGGRVPRHRPQALDVMAALGNEEAVDLLSDELETWKYSANLLACREVLDQLDAGFWNESINHRWIDSLRSLDADLTAEPHAPAALQSRAWQRKQLQTQLASWAELRRDNILYAKQSYGVPGCAFPCGYVEPYPEFYAKVKSLADTAGALLGGLVPASSSAARVKILEENRARQVAFFTEMSATMTTLEQIARDELRGAPQSAEQRDFLRKMFDDTASLKFGSAQLPDYSGWYCRLYYERHQDPTGWKPLESKPIVADVHTNPNDGEALEVATGHVRLLVIAIEGATQQTVYVGPVFSYYEFWQPAEQRLTDEEWRQQLFTGVAPPGPEWINDFAPAATVRPPENPRVTIKRFGDLFSVESVHASQGGSQSTETAGPGAVYSFARHPSVHALDLSGPAFDDQALDALSRLPDLRSLILSSSRITDEGVTFLKKHRHLQSLDVSKTAITDAGLEVLVDLPYLSQLDLRETRVTEAGVRKLRDRMPYTEVRY